MTGWLALLAPGGLAMWTAVPAAARVRRGLEDTGSFPLEVTLVCSAFAAAGALLLLWVGFEIRPGR